MQCVPSALFLTLLSVQYSKWQMALLFPFATSKMSKFDELTPPNTPYAAKYRLFSWVAWYLRGLKSMSILIWVYLEVRYNLLKNILWSAFWNWSKVLYLSWLILSWYYYQFQTRQLEPSVDLLNWNYRKHRDVKYYYFIIFLWRSTFKLWWFG